MNKTRISVALHSYDRVQPLLDQRVRIEGCDPIFIDLRAEEAFQRALANREFDVTELSFSSYLAALSRGVSDYVAIPVFLSRAFRHSAIYIRSDRGIGAPSDLRGRVVGVPEYQMTAALWARGILADRYGVSPSDVSWRTGGLETPGRREKVALDLPADVEVRAIGPGETLSGLLARGDIDALISARAPSCLGRAAHVMRLFEDFRTAEEEYFRDTGLFPIMHVVAVRRALAEDLRWLPASLFKAFSQAKAVAMRDLADVGVLQVMLPWLHAEIARTRSLMGDDFWPYGIEANRRVLEATARYSHAQGLASRLFSPEEMFAEGSDLAVKV